MVSATRTPTGGVRRELLASDDDDDESGGKTPAFVEGYRALLREDDEVVAADDLSRG